MKGWGEKKAKVGLKTTNSRWKGERKGGGIGSKRARFLDQVPKGDEKVSIREKEPERGRVKSLSYTTHPLVKTFTIQRGKRNESREKT